MSRRSAADRASMAVLRDLLRLAARAPAPRPPRPGRRRLLQTGSRSQPACAASTAASPARPALGHRLHLDVVRDHHARRSSAPRAAARPRCAGESVAGSASSSSGTRTWPVMTAATPASTACRNGRQLDVLEPRARVVDHGQVQVRVDVGVAVAGEVLGAGGDAAALQAVDHGGAEPAHELGVVAERAVADDGVLRVRVHVHHRARSPSGCRRPRARRRAPPPSARACSSEPSRPSARSGGHTVQGSRSRATRPPSWSTATSRGRSWPASRAIDLQLAHELGHLLGRSRRCGRTGSRWPTP